MSTNFKLVLPLVLAAAGLVSLAAQAPPPPGAPADGWTPLFNGKSLTGWRAYQKPDTSGTRWKVEDGVLTVAASNEGDTKGARDIVTTATYGQFHLRWEWKIAPGGNSGVKYFVLEDQTAAIGHEYQIIDDERHADAKIGPHRQTAAFYDVLPAHDRKLTPAGEWNASEVIVRGTHVEHVLNGAKVLEYELDSADLRAAIARSKFKDVARFGKPQSGHILLQDHGDQVWYRRIEIRKLK